MNTAALARSIRGIWARRNAHGERVSLDIVAREQYALWGIVSPTVRDRVWAIMTGRAVSR